MMGVLWAAHYRAADGREPVRNFINELDTETQAAFDNPPDREEKSS